MFVSRISSVQTKDEAIELEGDERGSEVQTEAGGGAVNIQLNRAAR